MITLWINNNGGWDWTKTTGQRSKVVFEGPRADALASEYIKTHGHLVIEPDDETDWDKFPLCLYLFWPTCPHGLSARLCEDPINHYPADH